ncbi:ATP-binding protein [Parvularcula oceani]|uniref:ATP-binding protein n=1 Tax=Parvularcula oceani TaxID=1247963 RepID=UPI0004E1227B|nr:ATP-binding protein [Parvularcula oceani]
MAKNTDTSDRLLTEVERQQKYLDRLPEDYTYPLFNGQHALESQRRSGYRNTAAAAREIVDNAIEAGAENVHVVFRLPTVKTREKGQRKNAVTAVAFIDDGAGMLAEMARYALSWGAGTHFDEPGTIGKFGFGLPNASINQTRLVEVYTKTDDAQTFSKTMLDAREVPQFGEQRIGAPVDADLPDFVQRYLDEKGIRLDHGTVVVWQDPDRLTFRTAANLREHLMQDFGVTYRYMLEQCQIFVDGRALEPIDPLFLMPSARLFVSSEDGGAEQTMIRDIAVAYRQGEEGEYHLDAYDSIADIDPNEEGLLALGAVQIRVSEFPYGFAVGDKKDAPADAKARFEIRKGRRGMAFVRANREIETVDVFPTSTKEESKGLGSWPLLQSYAYHWGAELRFDPDLDEVFGITNDKQTVRPVEELWRLLSNDDIGLDDHLQRANRQQRTIRNKKAREEKRRQSEAENDEPSRGEAATAAVSSSTGQRAKPSARKMGEARERFEEAAAKKAKIANTSVEAAKDALERESRRRPYVIQFEDEKYGPFYRPEWQGNQLAIIINRSHPFFDVMYGPLMNDPAQASSKDALDVLLIALGVGEAKAGTDECEDWYKAQREDEWSKFLAKGLTLLDRTSRAGEEEEEDESNGSEADGLSHAAE